MFNKSEIDNFFYPKSIAVIGASNDIDKIGGYIFSQIKNLKGIKTYPINVKWNEVQEKRAYVNICDVKSHIDLAIIIIPSAYVLQTVSDSIKAGVKNLIIISAGFKETDSEGRKREEALKKLIKENDIKLIGPNCLGIINPELKLNLSFAKDIPEFSGTAFISQSGAVIDAIVDWSFKYNIGFSKIVSLGNMAGVDELEILEYLKDDPKTDSIVFYMETLEKGYKFSKVLRQISKKKPVVIIKPGTSDNAKEAIGSHTGSLAQDNILVQTLIEDNNGILVRNLNELYDVLIGFKSKYNNGKKTVIVTNAGGPGVITTDILSESGFELYKLKDFEKKKFDFLPKEASLNNPIDILGDAKSDRYLNTLEELNKIHDLDNICVLLTPQIMTDSLEIAKNLVEFKKKTKKNVFSCFLGDKQIKDAINYFNSNEFPNYETPFNAIVSQNYLREYKSFDYSNKHPKYNFDKKKIHKIKDMLFMREGLLDYETTKKVLDLFSIKVPKKYVIEKVQDLVNLEIDKKKTYVLKIDSKDLIHKLDVGGIEKGINYKNLKEKGVFMFERASKISKNFTLTLEEEVKGVEVIIGLKQDDSLGNFIMFGAGGTNVSVFRDVNFKSCSLSHKDSEELVKKSKIYTLLKGFRGSKSIHFEHLYELLVRMSYLQEVLPEIKEVDLNPVICNEKGVYLVDVKLIL